MESDFMSDIDQFSDAVGPSPEEDNTPLDIPSSPPVFQASNQPQPSSPGLPTLPAPKFADSGYLSERGHYSSNMIDDYNYDDNEDRSPDAQDLEVAAQYNSRRQNTAETTDATPSEMNVELEAPGDMGQLPHKMLLNLPPGRQPTGDNRRQLWLQGRSQNASTPSVHARLQKDLKLVRQRQAIRKVVDHQVLHVLVLEQSEVS
ncbi:hypothetical protein KC317_g21209 [Hortaea werneckii]|nr:hypothetical protein KC317_g21209 [Hortaea werneckii]